MAAAYFVLRIGLGLVCLWAAAAKIQHFTVFAPDLATARRLLVEDLARLRADGDRKDQILQPDPDWDVSAVLLDEPKVITFAVT